MDHRIHKLNHHPLAQVKPSIKASQKPVTSFREQLTSKIAEAEGLKISKHAQKRLDERKITIDSDVWKKIELRINEAKQKGVHDSLVVTPDATLVISAKNNTVITAMNREEAKEQIFTNINGTIIL